MYSDACDTHQSLWPAFMISNIALTFYEYINTWHRNREGPTLTDAPTTGLSWQELLMLLRNEKHCGKIQIFLTSPGNSDTPGEAK